MSKYQYGLIKLEEGTVDPTTGAVTVKGEIEVYQNTCVIDRPEPQQTNHFKQGDPNPKVSRFQRQPKTVTFNVFDRSAESKVNWLGGTSATVSGKTKWAESESSTGGVTTKCLIFTFEDGSKAIGRKVECVGRDSWNPNDTDVAVIPVKGTIMSSGIANVPAWEEEEV